MAKVMVIKMKEQQLRICSYDVLPDGSVKPSALQRYFQQIALDDIAACGASYPVLRAHSMVFVLTKLRVDFLQPIRSGDTVLLRTYAYRVEGVTFFRMFELVRNGETVCLADSRWVLLNYEQRTILRPSELPCAIPEQPCTIDPPVIPRRIPAVGEPTTVAKRQVLLTELDENHHLNNCCYSDYILDHAPIDVCSYPIRSFCILFDHEAYQNDVLELTYRNLEEGFSVIARNMTTEKPCFQSIFALDFSSKT